MLLLGRDDIKRKVIPALILLAVVTYVAYFVFPGPDTWCSTQVDDKKIHGESRRACLYESLYESGEVRVRSWETRDKEYIYQEFYKESTPQYSITYWNEDGRRCKKIERINNRYVPEGVECTDT